METYLSILRQKGLKVTPLRKAILDAFQSKRSTLTADQLYASVRRYVPRAGLQSIYRNLSDFQEAGIAEEVLTGRRGSVFALCHNALGHHHHLICRSCGRSEEINPCAIDSAMRAMNRSFRRIGKKIRFHIERHFLQLEGICDACRKD
jgi:Fur family transcriptional regulator, ferric uptake regulator